MTLHSTVRTVGRRIVRQADHVFMQTVPAPFPGGTAIPPTVMLLIYRHRNSALALKLVNEAVALGIRPFLWALDKAAPSLCPWTAGCGLGLRSALLNRLTQMSCATPNEFILICDDDIELAYGSLMSFINFTIQGGFILAQPTHTFDSHYSFAITRGRPHLIARSTEFVEIGPLVLVHPTFRDRVFPMDPALGMGWAEAVNWSVRKASQERFGIIDAVRLRHLGLIGTDYDTTSEQASLDRTLQASGLASLQPILKTVDCWYRGQSEPSWRNL